MGILEGEGGGGAILPRLGAEVVVEAGAGGHGLGVEIRGEGAILRADDKVSILASHKTSVRAPAATSRIMGNFPSGACTQRILVRAPEQLAGCANHGHAQAATSKGVLVWCASPISCRAAIPSLAQAGRTCQANLPCAGVPPPADHLCPFSPLRPLLHAPSTSARPGRGQALTKTTALRPHQPES